MDQARPLIIKRKKVSGGDGHHGGAWKVAYADFVTAMMAFFLLMWLLNATSEDQRKGLADFFDPKLPISRNSAGGAGMLDGDMIMAPPDTAGSQAEGVRPKPTHAEPGKDLGEETHSPDLPEATEAASSAPAGISPESAPAKDGEKQASGPADDGERQATGPAEDGTGQLEDVAEDLLAEVKAAGQQGLMQHFSMRVTPEGLVIEIGDLQDEPLFASGSLKPAPTLTELINLLVPVLNRTTNDIAVVGHTDATPFPDTSRYSNWELSADRANVARRLLTAGGLPKARIVRVSGKAATDPIEPDPTAPRNRRIAITLLRRGQAG